MSRARGHNGPTCPRCGRVILRARVDGAWITLDTDPREPAPGLIGFNPRRETGRELGETDLVEAWRWAYAGATFHERHALTCRGAAVAPGQDRLVL